MGIQFSDWVENIVGKGEISYNIFKSCLVLIRQNEYLWSKGLVLARADDLGSDFHSMLSNRDHQSSFHIY